MMNEEVTRDDDFNTRRERRAASRLQTIFRFFFFSFDYDDALLMQRCTTPATIVGTKRAPYGS
jgi:hypothetical protein